MKYDITQEDKDIMAYDMQNDRTLKHIKNVGFYKFAIGEVLIREDKYKAGVNYDEIVWKPYMAECGLPYKYVYLFENELGVGYIRRLSINGRKFVERPICVTQFDPDSTRFTTDPEFADHLMLSEADETFNAKDSYEELKKKREAINRKNKKIKVGFATPAEAIDFVKNIKIGTQVWYGHSRNGVNKDPYFVTEVGADPQRTGRAWDGSPYPPQPEENLAYFTISKTLNATPNSYPYPNKIYAQSLVNNGWSYIYLQRPTFFDEQIS